MQLLRFGRLITPLANGDMLDLLPGWLALDRAGLILGVGRGSPPEALKGFRITDLHKFVATPGFVDGHLHFPQIDARGQGGGDLLRWLDHTVFPVEEACADPRVASRLAARTFRELARNGVTTAAVYGSSHAEATDAAFGEAQRSGLRIFLGKVMMDRNAPAPLLQSRERNIEESRRLCLRWDHKLHDRLRYAFSPRFAPACSFELLRDAAQSARELGALVQTHLAESRREVAWVRELFAGVSYTEVYRAAGLLSPQTVLGHAIHLDDSEWTLLKSHQAAIAHCPTSNFFLRSGAFDLARAIAEGIRCGLGSDVGAGPSFNPFDVMRHVLYLAPITPGDALELATLGGAGALGVGDRVGSLEVEKDADVAVLDPEGVGMRLDAHLESLLGALIHREAHVVGTLARGEWVHADPALGL